MCKFITKKIIRRGFVNMLNWGTAIWQLFNVLVLIALIFGIPYYLFQSFKRQKRIEEKLTEIAEYLKNARN